MPDRCAVRLSLDHLTAVDAPPEELARLAAQTGCAGICLFLHAMAVLPRMPAFDLVADARRRREVRARCRALGLAVDLVYPFTLTGRTAPDDTRAALDAAADLEAAGVNVLVYDRDPARRQDTFAAFCALARQRGLKVALEFYPPSQVSSLGAAADLVEQAGPAGQVGLTVDALHLVRSGGSIADLARVRAERIFVAQVCDGPAEADAAAREAEAAKERLLPGHGMFDLAGFVAALPASARLTVEVPTESAIARGIPALQRVEAAVAAARSIVDRARGTS
ncbi:sugar phosphate isomerase/epimerase family protein [Xanthobacter wiegelii]|uniref:sugar phosphate isomerase/epimerase family protein n=1 Tax=Xanthobacter wiegelii TaxID=3119913 RepID=UPI0037296C66